MNPHLTLATAGRVLRQLRRDRRTIALVVALPCVILGLLAWMFDGTDVLDRFGPIAVGLFPLLVMFLVTSVAMLRERTSGTLERLMTTPIGRGDVIAGYALAFGALATVQAAVVTGFAVLVGMDVEGPIGLVLAVAVVSALLGSAVGLAGSAIARTEFQAVQLMPAFVFPQLVVCGLLMPREAMPEVLEWISRVLPLTYAVEALGSLTRGGGWADVRGAVGVMVLWLAGAMVLGGLTLRRRTE
ncbi:ABC-2 type transport system permease protein [Salana multivorans]|uniref:Transport permease protein n=1 Tax=Salana multivorans TaxID=120377 RepID=A0A3N2DAM5_9MICO|nr:ABC transporter permease [Salana multivorans]MBN8882208.1 ABC transporter permease [Salana multivorans]OJX96921.1 MAG: antibiotic ABC transporter permease [Micrococcales bacterium 73-15]ROR96752.1 ABC-2 type transport system permease protein [Salana multivorans]